MRSSLLEIANFNKLGLYNLIQQANKAISKGDKIYGSILMNPNNFVTNEICCNQIILRLEPARFEFQFVTSKRDSYHLIISSERDLDKNLLYSVLNGIIPDVNNYEALLFPEKPIKLKDEILSPTDIGLNHSLNQFMAFVANNLYNLEVNN